MIELVIGLIAGSSFMYHNNDFVETVKEQREDGYDQEKTEARIGRTKTTRPYSKGWQRKKRKKYRRV